MSNLKCNICNETKPVDDFYKDNRMITGYKLQCKVCYNDTRLLKRRTKQGLVYHMYIHQKVHSKRRKHALPTYTKEELYEFAINNKEFNKLFDDWVKSNYDYWLVPTFDRLDNFNSYSFDNFNKWLTLKENNDTFREDVRNGKYISKMTHKKVIQLSLDNIKINKFESMAEASRKTNIIASSISAVCNGKRKTAGGYKWSYENMDDHNKLHE